MCFNNYVLCLTAFHLALWFLRCCSASLNLYSFSCCIYFSSSSDITLLSSPLVGVGNCLTLVVFIGCYLFPIEVIEFTKHSEIITSVSSCRFHHFFKVPLFSKIIFTQKNIFATAWWPDYFGKQVFGPAFFLRMLHPFTARRLGAFLARGRQYRRTWVRFTLWDHLRVSFTCETSKLSFLTQCLNFMYCFSELKTKVTQKMTELCTEYPFLTRVSERKEKKWINFAIFHFLCLSHCFMSEWTPGMT